MTRDVPVALKYYETVCGWSFDTMPTDTGDYHVAKKGDKPLAGIMDMTGLPGMEEAPAHWFTHLAVDDLEAAVSETTAQGVRSAVRRSRCPALAGSRSLPTRPVPPLGS